MQSVYVVDSFPWLPVTITGFVAPVFIVGKRGEAISPVSAAIFMVSRSI